MAGVISISHAECVQAFEILLRTLQNPPRKLVEPEYSLNVRNEFGRYKVWAGNVGAAHQGRTYKLSLDYRLKDASFYQERILEMLTDLRVTIQRVTSILNGERIPFDEQHGPSESDSEPYLSSDHEESSGWSSGSSASDSSGDGGTSLKNIRALVSSIDQKATSAPAERKRLTPTEVKEKHPDTEVVQVQKAIKDIVTSLYKVATVIRRPQPSDRHIKSTQTNVQHFAFFDQRYVSDKFPTAKVEILERLARGITRRRQLLTYRELHAKRLNITVKSEPLTNKGTAPDAVDINPEISPQINKVLSIANTASQTPNTDFIPSTKATTFVPKSLMIVEEAQSVADTASSYQSTASGQEIVAIPPRPRGLDGEELEEFECPYCHMLCNIRSSNAWKQHVLSDLEPYMCTFLGCSKPDQMYASRLDWYQHELEAHRKEWFCNTTGHASYRSQHEFENHMAENHASSVSNEHLASLMHNFVRAPMEEGSQCPLCRLIPKNLQRHLARHQAQLALFAIPRRYYGDLELEVDSAASAHVLDRSRSTATTVEASGDDNLQTKSVGQNSSIASSQDLYDTPIDIKQDLIPDCEDGDWNLPAGADGTAHWLNTGRKLKQPDLEPNTANFETESVRQTQLSLLTPPKREDWATRFNLIRDQVQNIPESEISRQVSLHEIVASEEIYMYQIDVLCMVYRDGIASRDPPVISKQRVARFISSVFGNIEAVKDVHENHLLPQLKRRQREQGPWIIGFGDIFEDWIRLAKTAYINYASAFPFARYQMRKESRNMIFRQFLDHAQDNKLSYHSDLYSLLEAPLTRLKRYLVLLETVDKHSIQGTAEKNNLASAIREIQKIVSECSTMVREQNRRVEILELQSKLRLRPELQKVELDLNQIRRKLFLKGPLQGTGTGLNRFRWLDTHAFLLDNYFIIAKPVIERAESPATEDEEVYDVSISPIPMVLLVLQSIDGEPVTKASVKSVPVARDMPTSNNEDDATLMYPFTIKHLGRSDSYTLAAPSSENRRYWCDMIEEAKARYAAALYEQNAEPFRLRVIADTAFAKEESIYQPRIVATIHGSPLDRAITDMANTYGHEPRPVPVCRTQVNCATSSNYNGTSWVAVGTDYGVYISVLTQPRVWSRVIQLSRVTQIAVLEQFSFCLVLADESLIAYHLSLIIPSIYGPIRERPRLTPQKLSGSNKVSFFAIGRMNNRTLVFYNGREGLHSTFHVIEPVFPKTGEEKRLFGRTVESFRKYDEFYIPTESFGINLFNKTIAVSTKIGFELLTLVKKVPFSVPDRKNRETAAITARLEGQKPLGMFRLSTEEFFLCYEECGAYIDKHGEFSRSVIMEFVGRAKSAAKWGAFLLLFNTDFVEVRHADNGRLRQIIVGEDVRCLDYAVKKSAEDLAPTDVASATSSSPADDVEIGTLKIAMTHPGFPNYQLVLEMVLNDGVSA